MPKNDHVKLRDGRHLGFAEYGDLQGKPVLEFHGWCCSRIEGNLPVIKQAATKLHVRLMLEWMNYRMRLKWG